MSDERLLGSGETLKVNLINNVPPSFPAYTGLKPAGVVEPAVVEADKALESGSVENLVKLVTEAVSKGIRERFTKTKEAKKHADHSVEADREFVEAYVQFTHYVERLHLDSTVQAAHHHNIPKASVTEEHHKH